MKTIKYLQFQCHWFFAFFHGLPIIPNHNQAGVHQHSNNKKMQHSCVVTYSIALSYQFQNTTISITLNIIIYEFI